MNNSSKKKIFKDQKDIDAISEVLSRQQLSWNIGDIDNFMLGYWNSEDLIFTSSKNQPTYGWQATLERYKKSYPSKLEMGELKFKILNINLTAPKKAKLKGKWKIIRKDDNPNGLFWLELQKFKDHWLITKDSTLSFEL